MKLYIGEGRKGRATQKAAAFFLMGIAGNALAVSAPMQLEDCMTIQADAERLACYDKLAWSSRNAAAGSTRTATVLSPPDKTGDFVLRESQHDDGDASNLAAYWELHPALKRGTFNFRPHRENYLVATYNPTPNNSPYRPFQASTPGATGLAHNELVFQPGFKLKLAENPFNLPVDLWFGFTQRSF